MTKIRLFFTKKNRAKYISHLDMNRCMMRALKRSGLPVWYTEGFNPHMYLTFSLPISLGYESDYESVDLKLIQDIPLEDIPNQVNPFLPPDIQIFRAAPQIMDQKDIAWADYAIQLICEDGQEGQLLADLNATLSADEIKVMKKTKKAPKEVDLKPFIQLLDIETLSGKVSFRMRFATGLEMNINPSLLLDNIHTSVDVLNVAVTRIMVYNKKLEIFQ